MIVLGNILIGIGSILSGLIFVFTLLVFAAVVMSWVSADPRNPLVQFVKNVTDPLFAWVRRYVKPIGMIDLSPIVVILVLQLIDITIAKSLIEYGHHIKPQILL